LSRATSLRIPGATTTWHDYILVDGHIVAEKYSGATTATDYFVLDHLSSVAVVTDGTTGSPTYGQAIERDAYDAWGRRRNLDGSDNTACSIASTTTRGLAPRFHSMTSCCSPGRLIRRGC
jgi:hypothetical protein